MDNTGDFVLDLINAEGDPAGEPDCRVEFIRLDGVSFTPSNLWFANNPSGPKVPPLIAIGGSRSIRKSVSSGQDQRYNR